MRCTAIKCNEHFTLTHADKCPYGGFAHRTHNYLKMVLAQRAEQAYGTFSVLVEPMYGKVEYGARDTLSGTLDSLACGDFTIRNFNGMQK